MKKFEEITFRMYGKTYKIPVTKQNVYGDAIIYLPLTDRSVLAVTQERPMSRKPFYSIKHFWPTEKAESVRGGKKMVLSCIYVETARTLRGINHRLSRMLQAMQGEKIRLLGLLPDEQSFASAVCHRVRGIASIFGDRVEEREEWVFAGN